MASKKAATALLRAEVLALRRAGSPLDRPALAEKYGVGQTTVQSVRAEVDAALAAESTRPNGHPGGRTVQDFDGARLRALRHSAKLMQEELAKLSGVSRGEIGHLERAHRKPTIRTWRNLADALKVDADELLAKEKSWETSGTSAVAGS